MSILSWYSIWAVTLGVVVVYALMARFAAYVKRKEKAMIEAEAARDRNFRRLRESAIVAPGPIMASLPDIEIRLGRRNVSGPVNWPMFELRLMEQQEAARGLREALCGYCDTISNAISLRQLRRLALPAYPSSSDDQILGSLTRTYWRTITGE